MIVNWNDIAAECGNYKNGFVAVFRKYEGMSTDERDGANRVVKVTEATFARHFGFDPATFKRWVRDGGAQPRPPQMQADQVRRTARTVVRNHPDLVIDAIMGAPEGVQDEIYHEVKLRRAGVDTSEANRKAAQAGANRAVEPIRRNIASTGLTLCVAALKEAQEYLQEAISEGAVNEESVAPIIAAHDAFAFTLAEARFKVS